MRVIRKQTLSECNVGSVVTINGKFRRVKDIVKNQESNQAFVFFAGPLLRVNRNRKRAWNMYYGKLDEIVEAYRQK